MLAAVLGAALIGIEDRLQPPSPITGNAYEIDGLPQLAPDWEAAIAAFETDPLVARIFAPDLIRNMALTKRQEIVRFATLPEDEHWLSYLETV